MKKNTAIALALAIWGLFYVVAGQGWIEKTFIFPNAYKAEVMAASQKEQVSPALVAAVILAESKFKENAQSTPGAMGLMQLMPDTASWIREQKGETNVTDEEMREPGMNIDLGTWYLAYLLREFKGNKILALAAYNAGRGNVESWMEENHWDSTFSNIDKIPFAETREYVKKVLQFEKEYETIYTP